MTTAIVADDAPLIREAIAGVLVAAGIEVPALVATADALLAAVAAHRPDVVIVDIRMPPSYRLEGLRAARELRQQHPRLGILLLSQHVEPQYLTDLLAGGAGWTGYLLKERAAGVASFVEAVQTVAAGGCRFDPQIVSALVDTRRSGDAVASLSPRERQVLQLMAEGASNLAIGQRLRMGDKTIEGHVRRIFQRLGIADQPDVNRRVRAVLAYLSAASG